MREFTNLVYLDLQKTATTSIVAFLRTIIREPEIRHGAHTEPKKGHDTSKFHFISVREPLSTYISWFSYGATGRGGLYGALKKRGLTDLYSPDVDGFARWLEFMLDEDHALSIRKKYGRSDLQSLVGPLTHRLLTLSGIDFVRGINSAHIETRDELIEFFHQNRIYDYYVRTESLLTDLAALVGAIQKQARVRRKYRGINTPEHVKEILPVINVSKKIDGLNAAAVPDKLRARVREREWLIYDVFGYGDHPKGLEPPLAARAKG